VNVAGRGEDLGFNSSVATSSFDGSGIVEGATYVAFTGSTTRGVNVAVSEFGIDPD
jgi:hypothetical protein